MRYIRDKGDLHRLTKYQTFTKKIMSITFTNIRLGGGIEPYFRRRLFLCRKSNPLLSLGLNFLIGDFYKTNRIIFYVQVRLVSLSWFDSILKNFAHTSKQAKTNYWKSGMSFYLTRFNWSHHQLEHTFWVISN